MKTLIIAFLFGIIINASAGMYDEEPNYNFIKKENGISLYYRWIKMPDKTVVRELKSELVINSTPEKIINVLKNGSIAAQWMKGASEVNNLGRTSENQWHLYVQYDIPWPLSNQDCIVNYRISNPAPNSYLIQMNGVPEFIPAKEGVTRIQHLQGTWTIVSVNKSECKVVYTIFSGQAPKFPRWITDPIIQGNLIATMRAFKVTVENNN